MTRAALQRKTDIRAFLVCYVIVFLLFSVSFPVPLAFSQEPSPAPGEPSAPSPEEAPVPPTVPTPEEEEEKIPPAAPPALPGTPVAPGSLDLLAPGPTVPRPSPGLIDRFQRRLDLIRPGQLLFNLTVEEEYDDNAFRDDDDREHDYRTVIVPAIALERPGRKGSLSLRYTPRILQYARFSELNRVDHSLRAAASWNAGPAIRFTVTESLLFTEDEVTEANALGISERGLRQTTRNEVSPGMEVRLGPRSDLGFQYTNTLIDEEDEDDRTIHDGRITWRHRRPRGGISLTYNFTAGDREESDFVRHGGILRTTRRVSPRDDLSLTASGSFRDEEDDDDVTILTGDVGLTHRFRSWLSANVSGGVQHLDERGSDTETAFSTSSSLTWIFPRGSLTLGVDQGFQETFATTDDEGTVLETTGSVSFSYQAGPWLSVSARGSYSRADFQDQDRLDLIGRASLDIRYQISRLVSLTAGYNFFDRNSDEAGEDLTNNRIFIGLSVGLSTPL